MNKLLASTVALALLAGTSATNASSTVTLAIPANNEIATKSELALPLNALTADVPYMVTCQVESHSPSALDISVTPRLAPQGGFGVAKVNGKDMLKNVGTLQAGPNTVSFMASIANASQANAMVLKNLDGRFSSVVKSCEAKPVTNVTSAANKVQGGYFYIYNNLPYFVDITVGSYSPTGYCLYPNSKSYITVSTAYQDIAIIGTHY